MVIVYFTMICAFGLSGYFLLRIITGNLKQGGGFHIFISGVKQGLTKTGVHFPQKRLPLELYTWQICDECLDCDECLEKASQKPMDIANWIRVGLPGTPEGQCAREDRCTCRVILHTQLPAPKS